MSVIVILSQITGNLILIAFYGALLGAAAKMISGGQIQCWIYWDRYILFDNVLHAEVFRWAVYVYIHALVTRMKVCDTVIRRNEWNGYDCEVYMIIKYMYATSVRQLCISMPQVYMSTSQ